uniref:Glycosyltransferase family 92 protein n=1 Tax=Caenorhabditis tropicalis TaxID=1561998 RepID=A0A1I7V037_9PELO
MIHTCQMRSNLAFYLNDSFSFFSLPTVPCHVENWNQKHTKEFPFYSLYKYFGEKQVTGGEGLSDGQLRLLTAFLYEEYIVVTHTAQNPKGVGRTAYCHYYDCNRIEISGSKFKSFVFPMTAVHCPRRIGAQYVSLSFEDKPPTEEPIPLLNRIFECDLISYLIKNNNLISVPPHEIGVCVGQIYGDERKWLEIVEYIEHHKLMGASMFYFTILEMDGYTKRTIEDYQRLGEIEATFVNTEYEKINWLFHMIQVHVCLRIS